LESYEKIYVKASFLQTEHGQIPCQQCHGGDPEDANWQTAHQGVVKDPTFPDPTKVCSDCHESIAASAPRSLHYTNAPMRATISARSSLNNPERRQTIDLAFDRHCNTCHASCGQCHVSRPAYVNGGFLSNHHFSKPPMETVCAGCHGGRVFAEYTGAKADYPADIHYSKAKKKCADCHPADELHADGSDKANRFEAAKQPTCRSCHTDLEADGNRFHAQHLSDLACQVCHAQANKNCFECHVGTDTKGLPYFKCKQTRMLFKIGRNPNRTVDRPFKYMVLRHAPATPALFDNYAKNVLDRFSSLPTWKRDAPHSIQRHTPQNKGCNACHGHAELFLRSEDVSEWERQANKPVIVPEENLPKPKKEVGNET
jgi:hypothetical protein